MPVVNGSGFVRNRKSRKVKSQRNSVSGPLVPRPLHLGEDVHSFVRLVDYGVLGKAVADQGYGIGFSLQDVSSYTEFTSLFNAFRINRVDVTFLYQQTINTSTFCFPTLFVSYDANDIAVPASEAVLLERANTKVMAFSTNRMMINFSLRPNMLAATSGLAIAAELPKTTWCDSADPSNTFYGLKVWAQNYNTGISGNMQIRVLFKYHMSFKTAR